MRGAGRLAVVSALLHRQHPGAVVVDVLGAFAPPAALLDDREVDAEPGPVETGEVLLRRRRPGPVRVGLGLEGVDVADVVAGAASIVPGARSAVTDLTARR